MTSQKTAQNTPQTPHTPQAPPETATRRCYSLYGKTVSSNYPLPFSILPESPADITITFEGIIPRTEDRPPNRSGRIWRRENGRHVLRFYNATGHMNQFLIDADGSQIRITQSWPEWRDTLFPLINAAMAASLALMGQPLLHAASLVRDGRSTLVMGISSAGKSTLSAALAACGMSVHTDDIAALQWNEKSHPVVMPGYPGIKIDPRLPKILGMPDLPLLPIYSTRSESGPSVGADPEDPGMTIDSEMATNHEMAEDHNIATERGMAAERRTTADPGITAERRTTADPGITAERGVAADHEMAVPKNDASQYESESSLRGQEHWLPGEHLPGGFYAEPASLNTMIILAERKKNITEPQIDRLAAASAGMALTEHVYGRDWLNPPGPGSLTLCTRLAQTVPLYVVSMPDRLDALKKSAECIERDLVQS